jgi:acyl dehydratase
VKPVPIGAGLVARRVRLDKRDVYVLGGILGGEDHLASIHGEPDASEGRVTITVLTTDARAAVLDAWLDELRSELDLELLGGEE